MTILASQPFKGIYALSALGFELARFPLFMVKYLSSYGRQHPEWTFRQAIGVRLLASLIYHIAKLHLVTPLSLLPGKEGERWVVIKPAHEHVYRGPLRMDTHVNPIEIGATWYPAPLTPGSNKDNVTVILHIHGGAFVLGDGRTRSNGFMAKLLLKHATATHVICPQYRLSTMPISETCNPFPAALQDSLTTYLYLINDLNMSPKDIVLSGDSAGANLAIALLRYISEHGADLDVPGPASCLLWSPWIDPSDTSNSYVYDNANYATDYISTAFTQWGAGAYAGVAGVPSLSQPYINHKLKTFKTGTQLWVHAGDAELLYYDSKEWAEKMKDAGNDVTFASEKKAPHDVLAIGHVLGFGREAVRSAKQAGEWLKNKA
ncbi:hypothetical protein ACEQ8H_004751 [Pleosporales sp. CAS-2024a]